MHLPPTRKIRYLPQVSPLDFATHSLRPAACSFRLMRSVNFDVEITAIVHPFQLVPAWAGRRGLVFLENCHRRAERRNLTEFGQCQLSSLACAVRRIDVSRAFRAGD